MNNLQEYLNNTFSINDQTSATIIITLFVFVFGILINQLLKLISEFINRRNLRKVFLLNLEGLEKKLTEQSTHYVLFSKQFDISYNENPSFVKINMSQLIILKEMGYKESFFAFFSGAENWIRFRASHRRSFNEIWDAVHELDFWHGVSLDMKDFNDNKSNYNNLRNAALQSFSNLLDLNLTQSNINHDDKNIATFFKDLHSIVEDWKKIPNKTRADVVHRKLVLKVRILNRKNQKYTIPVIVEFNKCLLDATLQYQNMKLLLQPYFARYIHLDILFRKHGLLINKGRQTLKNFF